jgi:hypothetical protein
MLVLPQGLTQVQISKSKHGSLDAAEMSVYAEKVDGKQKMKYFIWEKYFHKFLQRYALCIENFTHTYN